MYIFAQHCGLCGGSDTVGVILGTHIHERPQYSGAIDVGTNGEIVLAGNGRILACSSSGRPLLLKALRSNLGCALTAPLKPFILIMKPVPAKWMLLARKRQREFAVPGFSTLLLNFIKTISLISAADSAATPTIFTPGVKRTYGQD